MSNWNETERGGDRKDLLYEESSRKSEDRIPAAVREIASRIPESISSIGRDISRTIERAIAAKDDYIVAIKLSPYAQEKVDELVSSGVFRNRSEAASFLIEEGIKSQVGLFQRLEQKLSEIERIREELKGIRD
jgi:Arc/MetJ-type ribon-helix-helix transcriptional regulator